MCRSDTVRLICMSKHQHVHPRVGHDMSEAAVQAGHMGILGVCGGRVSYLGRVWSGTGDDPLAAKPCGSLFLVHLVGLAWSKVQRCKSAGCI